MKYFRPLQAFFTICIALGQFSAYAALQLSEQELALRVTSRILEAAETEGQFYEKQLTRADEKTWLTLKSKEITKSVLSDLFLKVSPGEVTEETVTEMVKRIPTEVIADFVRNSVRPILTYTRLKGVAVGLALTVSLSLEVGVPIFLAAVHHPELIPISAFLPYHILALSSGLSIQKKLIHDRLVALHGGRSNFNSFVETVRIARDNLIDDSASGLSLFVAGENGSAVYRYEKPSWFRNLARKLGWRDDKLTYSSLNQYCERRGMFNFFRKNLGNSQKTDLEKTWILLQAIYKTQNRDILLDLSIRYKKSLSPISEIANINEILPDVLEWTRNVLESKDMKALFEAAANPPEKATPYLISLIWENEIMPEFAARNEIPFGQMRRLATSFLEVQAKFLPLESFKNAKIRALWVKYLTLGSIPAVCDDPLINRKDFATENRNAL